jgi:hypothetical protein
MLDFTPESQCLLTDVAQRHGFSVEAALVVLRALAAQGGTMAQFSHPELGGMGQWSASGMVMVGDMFDQGLKRRVGALCSDLAAVSRRMAADRLAGPIREQVQSQRGWDSSTADAGWWPAELGAPASSGTQNGVRYAYFPAARRLAIQHGGRVEFYDTADHRIAGVSQQQSDGARGLSFSSDKGQVSLADLEPAGRAASSLAGAGPVPSDPLTLIERLAELHRKGILTEAEFVTKKAELLGRL